MRKRAKKVPVITSRASSKRPGVILVESHFRTLPKKHRIKKHFRNPRRDEEELARLGTRKGWRERLKRKKIMREITKSGIFETGVKRET
jgi:hypothetical protein